MGMTSQTSVMLARVLLPAWMGISQPGKARTRAVGGPRRKNVARPGRRGGQTARFDRRKLKYFPAGTGQRPGLRENAAVIFPAL